MRPLGATRRSSKRKRSPPRAITWNTPSCGMSQSLDRARQPTVSGTAGAPTSAAFADQAHAEGRARRFRQTLAISM